MPRQYTLKHLEEARTHHAHSSSRRLDTYAVRIRLGDWDVSSSNEFYSHMDVPVQWIVVHPEFYSGDLSNDLAIIRLQTYIDFATK